MTINRSVLPLLAIITAVFSLSLASNAGAVTIGSDLNRAPNVSYDCSVTPGVDQFGARLLLRQGVTSCTYLATPVGVTETPQAAKPGGVLTSVSVRVGPVTGPMQATILRFTRSIGFGAQCCYYQASSDVFTPRANAVTKVPVRLPMRNDLVLNEGEVVDYLALTVLAPGVPIPMQDLGGGLTPGAIAFYPSVKPGEVRVDGAGVGGLVPLISGEFTPTCSASATKSARAAAGSCSPALVFKSNRAKIRSNRVRTTLLCNLSADCVGKLKLRTKKKGGKTLASSKLNIAAAGSKNVKLRLTKTGRALMRKKRKRKAYVVSTLVVDGTKYTVTSKVSLRR